MRAKKSFGQHFLINEDIAHRIVESLGLWGEKPKVLEVGPGKGVLTKYLLQKDIELLVVEADADMVAWLNENYPALHGRIIAQDFLRLDLNTVFDSPQVDGINPASEIRPYHSRVEFPHPPVAVHHSPPLLRHFSLIGNFPYNISSQIVFKMIEHRDSIPQMVGMFQKEMAERIVAAPGSKDYGIISVLTQAFYEGKCLFTVGNRNFNPPPKVQSAVIRLVRKQGELGCDEALYRRVVKQAFSQRRKMLRNTLKPFFDDSSVLEDSFFTKRPEQLSLEEFVELTRMVETSKTGC